MGLRREIDQMGREVLVPENPLRIVSLVPSQTEVLYDLGLAERIVGQTIFCIHPHTHFKKATKIGGTKRLNLAKIRTLQPDLIIGNKEENERSQIEELSREFPVWMSNITTLEDALEMILSIGRITGCEHAALGIRHRINRLISGILLKPEDLTTAIYLIWKDPWMAAGKETFIHHMMQVAGYRNLLSGRYPELSIEEIIALKPEAILLSSEPFPFKDEHLNMFRSVLPETEVQLVDGEHFSWYGSRMIHALEAFSCDIK